MYSKHTQDEDTCSASYKNMYGGVINLCITEEMVLEISIIANGNNDNFVVLITDDRDNAQKHERRALPCKPSTPMYV